MELEIVYNSDDLIAINKPHGLLVHKSSIAKDATEFALQMLRDQIGQKVFPCHRLDRKTSGVLLFAKSEETLKKVRQIFEAESVQKTYIAIVRGHLEGSGIIDYDLNNEGKIQNAITHYQPTKNFEIPYPNGKFETSRYSLVQLQPKTGRFHQLRKHMAHLRHPIIGDRPHGCNKQNKFWKEQFEMTTMMLHAQKLEFELDGNKISIEAEKSDEFKKVLGILNEK